MGDAVERISDPTRSAAGVALAESEARFRQMADGAPVLIWISGPDKRCTWFNRPWLEFVGRSIEQEIGDGWTQNVHPDDLDRCLRTYVEAFDARRPFTLEYRLRRHDGAYRWMLDNGVPHHDSGGAFTGYIGSCVDITDRIDAERSVREAHRRYCHLVSCLPSAVYTTDAQGRITMFNEAAASIWGEAPPIGKSHWSGPYRILRPSGEPYPADLCPTARAIRDDDDAIDEPIIIERRDGTRRHAILSPRPTYDDHGRLDGAVNMLIDVTERKRAEERFRIAVEGSPNGVIMIDADGRIVLVNSQTEQMFGYTRQELLNQSVEMLVPQRYRGAHPAHRDRFAAAPRARPMGEGRDLFGLRQDGSEFPVEIGLNPIHTDDGVMVLSAIVDITERKRAEAAMRDSEERFRALADNISQLAWMCDADLGDCTWYNRRWYDYTGTRVAEMRGDGWKHVHHPDHLDRVLARVQAANERGVAWEDTFPLRGKDGQYRWFLSRALPIRDDTGRIVRWFGTNTDVTEQMRAADALRESESRFRDIADATPTKLWVSEPDGSFSFFSRRWFNVTGQTEATALGWGWLEAIHPDERAAARRMLLDATADRKPVRFDLRFLNVDHAYRWAVISGCPRFSAEGEFLGLIGSIVDITDRKIAEQTLLRINDELEQRVGDRTKALRALARELTQTEQRERKRLAQVMHDEIQQLLAVAKMNASLALDRIGDVEPMRQLVRVINEAIVACRTVTVNLSPPVVRDADLSTAMQWLSRYMADQHGLHVELHETEPVNHLPEDLRTLLFEMTRELLFNVVKHAEVTSARLTLGLDDGGVFVEVADEGRGCDAESLARPKPDSFGLFSIRERLVDLGGRIEADGAPGRGCRVRIHVPHESAPSRPRASAAPIATAAPPADARAAQGPVRVLLADDHAILRQGLAELLGGESDMKVVAEASDGVEAIRLAHEFKPDVVVMDINMPRLGGIDATRRIRGELPNVRVIGLSMHAQEDLASAMIAAGAEAFVNKCDPSAHLIAALRGERAPAER